MRLRQVVLVARDLEPVVDTLCAVLGTEVGFRDPGVKAFGLQNAVLPLGDTFLEVISPVEETAPARRYLERRGGDGGYMVMVQSDDLDADERRLSGLGVRIVWHGDLDDIRGRHLHPKDTGGTLLSLDQAMPPESWRWAGPRWKAIAQKGRVAEVVAAEIRAADPAAMARRWSEVLGRPAGPGAEIRLDRGAIRFTEAADPRDEGFAVLDVACADPKPVLDAARARGLHVGERSFAIAGATVRLVSPR